MKRTFIRAAVALAFPALLSGCYVVQINPDLLAKLIDQPQPGPALNPGSSAAQKPPAAAPAAGAPSTVAVPVGPTTLHARLYPANEIATENGMVSGTVTSMMNGKARFQISYRGETLIGEATWVSGDDRKGVASAWGANGSFMSCEYQMSSLVRGAGNCIFSDGARYQVHVGN